MKTKYIILVLVLLAASFSSALAGNSQRIGTAGATELLIPVGSRGTAMGGAVVSSVTGVESIYWNPAGLANAAQKNLVLMHNVWLDDITQEFASWQIMTGKLDKIITSHEVEDQLEQVNKCEVDTNEFADTQKGAH